MALNLRSFAILLFVGLVGCSDATEPEPTIPVHELDVTISLSRAVLSASDGPDSALIRIRIRNQFPVAVRILPESSFHDRGDFFTGEGVRYEFRLTRIDANGSGGGGGGLAWEAIILGPGDWVDIEQAVRTQDATWGLAPGRYIVHSTLQGRALPVLELRVTP